MRKKTKSWYLSAPAMGKQSKLFIDFLQGTHAQSHTSNSHQIPPGAQICCRGTAQLHGPCVFQIFRRFCNVIAITAITVVDQGLEQRTQTQMVRFNQDPGEPGRVGSPHEQHEPELQRKAPTSCRHGTMMWLPIINNILRTQLWQCPGPAGSAPHIPSSRSGNRFRTSFPGRGKRPPPAPRGRKITTFGPSASHIANLMSSWDPSCRNCWHCVGTRGVSFGTCPRLQVLRCDSTKISFVLAVGNT